MKKILVPTDFSDAAKNAARYALHMAIDLKADIELLNAMKVPAEAPMAAQVSWPLEDYQETRNETYFGLKALSAKLKADEIDLTLHQPDAYHPAITETAEVGNVTDVVRNIMSAHTVSMVIMGMSGAGGLRRFFLGSSSRDLIDHADFPVLLVPPQCTFERPEKIAFATNLDEADIKLISQLAAIVSPFNAEILLVHVTGEKYDKGELQKNTDNFLSEVTRETGYPKINYRHTQSRDVDAGLGWLSTHGKIDILAMAHRKPGVLGNLFETSYTQHLAKHIPIPLLVFPGKEKPAHIPVF